MAKQMQFSVVFPGAGMNVIYLFIMRSACMNTFRKGVTPVMLTAVGVLYNLHDSVLQFFYVFPLETKNITVWQCSKH